MCEKLVKVILSFLHYEINAIIRFRGLGVQSVKSARKLSMQALFTFLVLGDALGLSDVD